MGETIISIMQNLDEPRCYIRGSFRNLELHHCMSGANRKLSTRYGLVVFLCADHHRGRLGVHTDYIMKERLEKDAQRAFEAIHGHRLWMETFRKNYLKGARA